MVGALSVLLIAGLILCFIRIASGEYTSNNTDYAQKQNSYVNDFKHEQAADLPKLAILGSNCFMISQ
jgi:hypothetical protein